MHKTPYVKEPAHDAYDEDKVVIFVLCAIFRVLICGSPSNLFNTASSNLQACYMCCPFKTASFTKFRVNIKNDVEYGNTR